jgi:hypothetical protein
MLREEHRLSVFENRVLRKIYLPKRDEVTGEQHSQKSLALEDCWSFSVAVPTSNSVALVRKRITLIERPLLVGEVSAKFCGLGYATWSA